MAKRTDYLSWNDYFMFNAILASKRSKDPRTQVGACIVNDKNRIVSIGYNGFPNGCDDDVYPWASHQDGKSLLECKRLYVCHAEMNAVMNRNAKSLKGCTIYTTLFPCNHCAQIIIQSEIKRVVYLDDKYADRDEFKAARRMMTSAGIEMVKHRFDDRRNGSLVLECEPPGQ